MASSSTRPWTLSAVRLDWSRSTAVSVDSMSSGCALPGPARSAARARAGVAGPDEEEVGPVAARGAPRSGRGSRRGRRPPGTRGTARRGRPRRIAPASGARSRARRAPGRGRRPRSRAPRPTATGRAVPRASPAAPRRGPRRAGARRPRKPAGSIAARSRVSWSSGPIRTAFSRLKTTGVAAATPGTSRLDAVARRTRAGTEDARRHAQVRADDEPGVGGLRGVVGGAEDRKRGAERDRRGRRR